MKHFKRHGEALFGLCFMDGMIAFCLIIFMLANWEIPIEIYLITVGGMLALLLVFVIDIPGLFTDTVYYDGTSVKLVTKKNTVEYKWSEIKAFCPIWGNFGGVGGWDIIPYEGKPISVSPAGSRFYRFLNNYVRKEYPNIKVDTKGRSNRTKTDTY